MNSEILSLNRKLGDALGYVRSGTQPRFCWQWAPDIPYWSRHLGQVWVLCQWQKPGLTEEEWQRQFNGRYPYPANGMHHAHPESALPVGMRPTPELTQKAIRFLDEQMSTSFIQQLCDVHNEMAEHKAQTDQEWEDRVFETAPAFGNYALGSRGGHVSYGGTDGSR